MRVIVNNPLVIETSSILGKASAENENERERDRLYLWPSVVEQQTEGPKEGLI